MQVSVAAGIDRAVCEGLYKQHRTFLGLPHSAALAAAFVAMVQDHYNNLKQEEEGKEVGGGSQQQHANGSAPATAGDPMEAGSDAEMAQDADDEDNSLPVSSPPAFEVAARPVAHARII
jgi:hypothetical protein